MRSGAAHFHRSRPAISLALAMGACAGCEGAKGAVFTPRPEETPPQHTRSELIKYGGHVFDGVEDLRLLAGILDAVEQSPFDGLVLDLGGLARGAPWSAPPLDRSALEPAAAVLRQTPFRKLKANFQRLGTAPVSLDWFDDARLAAAAANFRTAAQLVREAGLRGFFFDTQAYGSVLWRHRAGDGAGRTFAEVEEKVKQRGFELMSALMEGFPDAAVLLTVGYSELFRSTCIEGQPLEQSRYALLPAFLDGMFKARADARSSAVLVDAFLPAYPTREVGAFRLYYDLIHFNWDAAVAHWIPGVVTYLFPDGGDPGSGANRWPEQPALSCRDEERRKVTRDMPAGFGLMLDYDHWSRGGGLHAAPAEHARNYFGPDHFGAVVRTALRTADRYVWVWTSTVDWWDLPGRPQARVPDEYVRAVAAAKQDAARN